MPTISQEKSNYSDVFTQFIEALYEEFDFDLAFKLAKQVKDEADKDLILKPFAGRIHEEAIVLLYQTKCKIYRTINVQ